MSMLTLGSTDRPEPVLDAAKLAAAVSGTVTAIGTIFVLVGWATADTVNNWAVIAGGIVTSIGTLITVALPIITALGARAQVTPLAAPVSVEGVPLITSAAPQLVPTTPPPGITHGLSDLPDVTSPIGPTRELPAVGTWRPPTPAAAAAEPTPIEAEAAAAAARH